MHARLHISPRPIFDSRIFRSESYRLKFVVDDSAPIHMTTTLYNRSGACDAMLRVSNTSQVLLINPFSDLKLCSLLRCSVSLYTLLWPRLPFSLILLGSLERQKHNDEFPSFNFRLVCNENLGIFEWSFLDSKHDVFVFFEK